MIISHYKRTPLALAPDVLSECINKYTNHTSYVNDKFQHCDIIQYHNRYFKFNEMKKQSLMKKIILAKPSLMLHHSFPEITDNYHDIFTLYNNSIVMKIIKRGILRAGVSSFFDAKKHNFLKQLSKDKVKKIKPMVIGQYQATLKAYQNYKVVRNIIDFNDKVFNEQHASNSEIKIGYSPTVTKKRTRSIWENKGYQKTIEIIKKIAKYRNIKYDIIIDVPHTECIQRKSQCNILIDECVTHSYHKCALEGLALGKLTICSLGTEVQNILKKLTHCCNIPFENIWIESLEAELMRIIDSGSDAINERGKQNRVWMEKYWHPIAITHEYINLYEELLANS